MLFLFLVSSLLPWFGSGESCRSRWQRAGQCDAAPIVLGAAQRFGHHAGPRAVHPQRRFVSRESRHPRFETLHSRCQPGLCDTAPSVLGAEDPRRSGYTAGRPNLNSWAGSVARAVHNRASAPRSGREKRGLARGRNSGNSAVARSLVYPGPYGPFPIPPKLTPETGIGNKEIFVTLLRSYFWGQQNCKLRLIHYAIQIDYAGIWEFGRYDGTNGKLRHRASREHGEEVICAFKTRATREEITGFMKQLTDGQDWSWRFPNCVTVAKAVVDRWGSLRCRDLAAQGVNNFIRAAKASPKIIWNKLGGAGPWCENGSSGSSSR